MAASTFIVRSVFAAALAFGLAWALAAGDARTPLPDPLTTPASAAGPVKGATTAGVARHGERLVAVGPRGLILLSTDGAKTWQKVSSPVATDLVGVRFTDARAVWAVGHDGVALRSRDGGATWERVLDGRSLLTLLTTVYEQRAKAGEAGAEAARKEVALSAGQSATPGVLPSPLLDVWFADAKEGYLVGAFGLLLRTLDGGTTWEPFSERTDNERRYHLYAVGGVGAQRYIAGEQGLLLRWDAAAARFTKVATPYIGSYFGLDVTAERLVVFGLRGNAFVSEDQGASWKKIVTGTDANLVSLVRLTAGRYLLVSQAGELLSMNPGSLKATPLQVPLTTEVFGAVEGKARSLVLAQINGLRDVELLGLPLP